ncbi:hydroxyacylglutathione hydrolase [Chitinimonas sp. PSY-7]|uniref:hydroxyacylglutathione hydrolase n=1 Tax=Chitinimonas sp. PSY-7 TaxID=3459088 RepID=UPI00403FED37
MLNILPVPILNDNYVWLAYQAGRTLVVDPGDAGPVRAKLAELGLEPAAILITHHHSDHIAGLAELIAAYRCPVFGPAGIAGIDHVLNDGDRLQVPGFAAEFEVMAVPGHTQDHLAYYGEGILFCGDTLFACGCGRLFEGTPRQMQSSLARLAALPDETLVCCTHEYTVANQRFARAAEPKNAALQQRAAEDAARRTRDEPTLPSTIGREKATNPFLRWTSPDLMTAAARHGASNSSPEEVFAALRRWKDVF